MGWDNPPVPWREFERRLSWGTQAPRPVTRLPGAADLPAADSPEATPWSGAPGAALPRAALPWAELHCHSSYSFLDGASSPAELVNEAARLGLSALAITDHDGMYGVPQFAQAAVRMRAAGTELGTVFGAELSLGLSRKIKGGIGARARGSRSAGGSARDAGQAAEFHEPFRRRGGVATCVLQAAHRARGRAA